MPKLVCHIEVKGRGSLGAADSTNNEFWVTHIIPPCSDGTPNAAALAAFLAKARELNPAAFDPSKPSIEDLIRTAIPVGDAEWSTALANMHHDEAEAPNPLNTGDTVGPGEG